MKTRLFSLTLSIVLAAGWIGCSEQPLQPEEEAKKAPPLPPVESLRLDFSEFQTEGRLAIDPEGLAETGEAAAGLHWLNAAVRVAFINVAVVTTLTPPAAAFFSALTVDPVVEEDGTFLWSYQWKETPGHAVLIDLRGRIDGVTVHWSLRVTDDQADPPLDEFLWYYGDANYVANSGYWIIRDLDAGTEEEVARIDWDYASLKDRQLAFENIDVDGVGYGDQLTYSVDGSICSIEFFDASEALRSDITWDQISGVGSLMVPDYNHGERACWDENQDNTVCPEEG